MLQSAYRKEWFVETCIAKELLGTPTGSRLPTIADYAESFSCSRGIVQNALANLESKQVIILDRLGKRGTYLAGKEEEGLFACSGLRHLTASMPPPVNRYFAGLATGICQQMNACPLPFTFAFVQGSRNRVQALAAGAYDFVVITGYSARFYEEKYPEVEMAFPFADSVYSLPHKLYISHPGKTQIEDGMTVAVDPSSYDQVAITRQLCRGKRVQILEMPLVSAAYSFYSGKIDCLVFRDGIRQASDNLLNLVMSRADCLPPEQISQIALRPGEPDMEQPVALVSRKNHGIKGILQQYLAGEQVGAIQKKVMDGTMLPQFY